MGLVLCDIVAGTIHNTEVSWSVMMALVLCDIVVFWSMTIGLYCPCHWDHLIHDAIISIFIHYVMGSWSMTLGHIGQ